MRINVSDIIRDPNLGSTTFTRRRPTVSLVNRGTSKKTYTDTPMTGIVQAASTSDAQLLEEGVRLTDVQAFFTSGNLTAGDGATTLPDVLVHKGQSYRVLHVADFGEHGMVKALAQKFNAGTPPAPQGQGGNGGN